jgi:hypothetical protein
MFSGFLAGGEMPNDAWVFDGTTWVDRSLPSGAPEGRRFALNAHDEERGITVLAGGYADFTARKDAWSWDGIAWAPLPTLPGGRYGGAMVWDASAQALLALSGVNDAVEVLELAFEPTGPAWVDVSAAGGPVLPTESHPYLDAAFDRKRSVTVLFFRGDTWEFERASRTWRLTTQEGPGNRRGPALAYDAESERVVLFGGMAGDGTKTIYDDTWEYDGTAWHAAAPEGRPPERWEGKLAYEAPRRRLVLFGGGGTNDTINPPAPWAPAAVTWVYSAADSP